MRYSLHKCHRLVHIFNYFPEFINNKMCHIFSVNFSKIFCFTLLEKLHDNVKQKIMHINSDMKNKVIMRSPTIICFIFNNSINYSFLQMIFSIQSYL